MAVALNDATPAVLELTLPPVAMLAPEPGPAKVTLSPSSAAPSESTTVAASAVAKALLMGVVCGVPAVAVRAVGAPRS